jgi:hypothetical protein
MTDRCDVYQHSTTLWVYGNTSDIRYSVDPIVEAHRLIACIVRRSVDVGKIDCLLDSQSLQFERAE